jgi:hypothetical protein
MGDTFPEKAYPITDIPTIRKAVTKGEYLLPEDVVVTGGK